MQAATRYRLAAMGGLALLAGAHQVRNRHLSPSPPVDYLIGTLPNFAAAIVITFVLLILWSDLDRAADRAATRRVFLICAAISGVGLVAWELFQLRSKSLVFDPHDIGATLVGLGVSALLFAALTPQSPPTQ